jgi:hypothetical protein
MKISLAKPAMMVILFLTAAMVYAQKAALLTGKWKYADIADKEKLDSNIVKQGKLLFAKMEMEFAPDGKYSYNPLGDNPQSMYTGTWTLNKEQTKVTVSVSRPSAPDKKQTSEWEIKMLTDTDLRLDMGNAVIVFDKKPDEVLVRQKLIKERLQKKTVYNEGLAAIGINDQWGFVDSVGKEMIPFKYSYTENFIDGLAMARTGKYPNYKEGFIDKTGKEVVPLIYNRVGKFGEGLCPVNLNDNWGYVDKTGKLAIPLQYGGTWDFKEGLAMVRNGRYMVGKCGFIDKTGKVVIPLKYEQGDEGFKEGLALVVLDRKYGFIDKTGQEIVPPKYKFAFSFKEGLACVNLDGKWGFINQSGNVAVPVIYDNSGGVFSEGLAMVTKDEKRGYVDKTGKVIIPLQYGKSHDFTEGLAAVSLNGLWGFIDKKGKVIIPLIYSTAYSFNEGRAYVTLNNRSFQIDKKGKEISDKISTPTKAAAAKK